MSRSHDAVLAATLCFLTVLFGWLADASAVVGLVLAGAVAAVGAELLVYRRPTAVRSLFDRPAASAVGAAIAGVAIGAGAIIAPDRTLSFVVGALGTYLLLLGVVEVSGWSPGDAGA